MTRSCQAQADLTREGIVIRELFNGATAKSAMITAGFSVATSNKSAGRTLRSRRARNAMLEFLERDELDLDGISPREALCRIDLILKILG